jgi:hypothetical protein
MFVKAGAETWQQITESISESTALKEYTDIQGKLCHDFGLFGNHNKSNTVVINITVVKNRKLNTPDATRVRMAYNKMFSDILKMQWRNTFTNLSNVEISRQKIEQLIDAEEEKKKEKAEKEAETEKKDGKEDEKAETEKKEKAEKDKAWIYNHCITCGKSHPEWNLYIETKLDDKTKYNELYSPPEYVVHTCYNGPSHITLNNIFSNPELVFKNAVDVKQIESIWACSPVEREYGRLTKIASQYYDNQIGPYNFLLIVLHDTTLLADLSSSSSSSSSRTKKIMPNAKMSDIVHKEVPHTPYDTFVSAGQRPPFLSNWLTQFAHSFTSSSYTKEKLLKNIMARDENDILQHFTPTNLQKILKYPLNTADLSNSVQDLQTGVEKKNELYNQVMRRAANNNNLQQVIDTLDTLKQRNPSQGGASSRSVRRRFYKTRSLRQPPPVRHTHRKRMQLRSTPK